MISIILILAIGFFKFSPWYLFFLVITIYSDVAIFKNFIDLKRIRLAREVHKLNAMLTIRRLEHARNSKF